MLNETFFCDFQTPCVYFDFLRLVLKSTWPHRLWLEKWNGNEKICNGISFSCTISISKCKEYIFHLPDIKCKVPIRYTSKMELNPIQLWSKKYSGISPGKNLSQWALISLVVLARANLPNRVPGKWTKFRAITQCLFPPTLRHICKKIKSLWCPRIANLLKINCFDPQCLKILPKCLIWIFAPKCILQFYNFWRQN